jgi:hypothetical protein
MEDSQNDSGDGFRVSGACVNIAKDETEATEFTGTHQSTFELWFLGLPDRKIK